MILLLTGLHLLANADWYGPVVLSEKISTSGNPYDPTENAVEFQVKSPSGQVMDLPGYFEDGVWKAVLLTHEPGKQMVSVTENGNTKKSFQVDVPVTKRYDHHFIRLGGPRGFEKDDGTPFWPIGHDFAWRSGAKGISIPDGIKLMPSYGDNWSRIWCSFWDGKCPYWKSTDRDGSLTTFDQAALKQWDDIVTTASDSHVHFQMVLFHHGPWSSTTDSNWKENPWNKANGGFLAKPEDFFTDPRAKALAKAWLRYAVARYAWAPGIMAWEIFNEVQWTDGIHKEPAEVGKWHDEMADYIKSIDPYHHLVTTSSDMSLPIYREVDYYQPHSYSPNTFGDLITGKSPDSKPLFYGEIGPSDLNGPRPIQVRSIRDAIWAAFFAGQAGAGCYWDWDNVYGQSLQPEFSAASEILRVSGALNQTGMKLATGTIDGVQNHEYSANPPLGWAAFGKLDYQLAGTSNDLAGFSSYFQGTGHKDMRSGPVHLHFKAQTSGTLTITVTGCSDSGGNLTGTVDGKSATITAAKADSFPKNLALNFAPSDVDISLDNSGPDWVQIGKIAISGINLPVSWVGSANDTFAMVRVLLPADQTPSMVTLNGLPFADGNYSFEQFLLPPTNAAGIAGNGANSQLKLSEGTAVITGGSATFKLEPGQESILCIKKN